MIGIESLVSVIIPTFKRKKEIVRRAVKSVMAQTYQNIEIIIVDDSPEEFQGSIKIKEYLDSLKDERVKYIKHSENKGANAARNTGIRNSKGNFLAFLDDDDEWLPMKIEKQIQQFKCDQIGMVYCPYLIVNEDEKYLYKSPLKSGDLFEDLLYNNFIGSTSCVMVKKECVLKIGLFDENLQASQDYDLYIRLSEKYQIDFVKEPLLLYYIHDGERISGDPIKKQNARIYIYNKYNEHIKRYPKVHSKKNLLLSLGYADLNERSLKWKHWFKAVLLYPLPTKSLIKNTFKILFIK